MKTIPFQAGATRLGSARESAIAGWRAWDAALGLNYGIVAV